MLYFQNKQINYTFQQCQQCGACKEVCPTGAITFKRRKDGLVSIIVNHDECIKCKKCVKTCPANKQEINSTYFSQLPSKRYFFAYNKNAAIRKNASSGGVARTLLIESLKNNLVDAVYSLKKSDVYPFAEGTLYTQENIPTYEELTNSIYHSVITGQGVKEAKKVKRLMLIGTTCQLKALKELFKGKYEELITVALFCKQQKTLDSTRFLAKAMGTKLGANYQFTARYRGDGWPGIVKIMGVELAWNRAAQIPFGRRLWSVPGCNVCGDPFGITADADFSLMDPWIICKPNGLGDTLVTAHTEKAYQLMQQIEALGIEEKKYKEIEPALGLTDIRRKQQVIPYFSGNKCSTKIKLAGNMEQLQRRYLQFLAEKLPRMPFICYRIMCKLPDWRNIILK